MFERIVITTPDWFSDEAHYCNSLFSNGLRILHLRKPNATEAEMARFIEKIEPRYRGRIVLHSHYGLVERYALKGVHLKFASAGLFSDFEKWGSVSVSCHSYEEILSLPFVPAYVFLSPLFESVSKVGYSSDYHFFDKEKLEEVHRRGLSVIALGGITSDKVSLCRDFGFDGVAAIGAVWSHPEMAVAQYQLLSTPTVVSIAGFDPSSGAGVSSDLKVMETHGVYGLGVVSALTYQNESFFQKAEWCSDEQVLGQLSLLLEQHAPTVAKIGMIRDSEQLLAVVSLLRQRCPSIKIIWDPILKATATKDKLHESFFKKPLQELLREVDLITPNLTEAASIFGTTECSSLAEVARTTKCSILLKGGHSEDSSSVDTLISSDGEMTSFSVSRLPFDKHGTGCFLSSAIASYVSLGKNWKDACALAQREVSNFLKSNASRLGFHAMRKCSADLPSVEECPVMYITDHREGYTIAEQVEAVCRGGVRWVQLRMKEASDEEMLAEGWKVKEVCRRYNAVFIINDRVQVARQLDADGVHLGLSDMDPREARRILGEDKVIGATCNTCADLALRNSQKVDYVGVGPFRFTTTKKNLSPMLGLEGYRSILSFCGENHIHIPIFAIGGIKEDDLSDLFSVGITGIALSGTILKSDDPTETARRIVLNSNKEKYK
ncbi:MAG: thiamine phosphate synthase [Paludibacteraceae bacterium]|nr:thiamine phosphate synthase [Paludibacteraceae bacterium]